MTINSEQIQALKALYANVEKQAHALRGNPREYSVITGLCPINVIEMQAQKIQALLVESDADKALIAEQAKRIAELEARTLTVKLPEPFTKSMYGTPLYEHGDIVAMLTTAGITLVVGE